MSDEKTEPTVRKIRSVADINFPVENPVLAMMKHIAGDAKSVKTIAGLKPIQFIPTIIRSFNRAVVLGGAPINATWLIHGPPGGGKSAFAIALCESFIRLGHPAAYVDAEYALTTDWAKTLSPNIDSIMCERPTTFEDTIEQVDTWITNFAKAKKAGNIPADRALLIIIDTIHKLSPKREIKSILNSKEKGDNIDKGWGRYRANLISSWIDHLTPIVCSNDVLFVALAHEHEVPNTEPFSSKDDYRVKGGQALFFEAMIRTRISVAKKMWEDDKKFNRKRLVGKVHNIDVAKNKVGYPNEIATFFIGNGKGSVPLGFDLEREAFTEAELRGLIATGTKGYYTVPGYADKLHGEDQMVSYLRDNPIVFQKLCRILDEDTLTNRHESYEGIDDTNGDNESENTDS